MLMVRLDSYNNFYPVRYEPYLSTIVMETIPFHFCNKAKMYSAMNKLYERCI